MAAIIELFAFVTRQFASLLAVEGQPNECGSELGRGRAGFIFKLFNP